MPTEAKDVNENEIKKETKVENEWMIRPCSAYDDEYSDCTSIKARLHQYFVFGKTVDCSQWKCDANNCRRWKDNGDIRSANELIKSEKKRRYERLRHHYENNVWERRSEPPDDWNKPLPEFMLKEYEHSYLNLKSKELKGEIQSTEITSYCTIM